MLLRGLFPTDCFFAVSPRDIEALLPLLGQDISEAFQDIGHTLGYAHRRRSAKGTLEDSDSEGNSSVSRVCDPVCY